MILETLGMLAENESFNTAGGPTATGYCLDLASAYNKIGNSGQLWLVIKCTVTATGANGTFQFHLRKGTGTNGTDINAGNVDVISTDAIAVSTARTTAGGYILRVPLPMEMDLQYLQVWRTFAGTTPTISVDISVSPSQPPSDFNIQAGPLAPKTPIGE